MVKSEKLIILNTSRDQYGAFAMFPFGDSSIKYYSLFIIHFSLFTIHFSLFTFLNFPEFGCKVTNFFSNPQLYRA